MEFYKQDLVPQRYRPGQVIVQFSICDTVWKFHNFSITQNLREIAFGDSRSAKSTNSTHLEALNLDLYTFLHFLKAESYQIKNFRASKNEKMADF